MKARTALVVGAAGFIGRHLVPRLSDLGYAVTGVDPQLSPGGHTQPVPSGHGYGCTFEHWENGIAEDELYDVVIHLGANIESVDQRMAGGLDKYADIALDFAVCQYVAEHPPRECFVAVSSCVAGYPTPGDPYCLVKAVLEAFATCLHRAGVPVVILRPFAGFGPGQSLSYPVPSIICRALGHEDPLAVWGSLETERDFVFVSDIAEAIVWAIDSAPRGNPVDIGTGRSTKFGDLARMIARIVGYDPWILADITKPASHPRRVADTTLATAHGFEAKISLAEGIRRAVEEARAKAR